MTLEEEMIMIDEEIMYYKGIADLYDYEASKYETSDSHIHQVACEYAKKYHQLVECFKELKAYKELNTYNRSSKCSKCKHEDSAYFCDDCIWNFVNKFEQKEEMNGISN